MLARVSLKEKRMTEFVHQSAAGFTDGNAIGVGPARIDIAFQRLGSPDAPPVLLIMGISAQLIHWPDPFCRMLVDRGLQVIRFDNRDSGLSTHLTEAPPANLPAVLSGDFSSVSYTLSDMAADSIGLMDALSLGEAHVVGASMGGAIAQTMAIEHSGRVRSLTSMMATTGNRSVGQVAPDVMREVFSGPPAVTREEVIQQALRASRATGSPVYMRNEDEIAARAGRAYDRCHDPAGVARQAVASVASGDRTDRLRTLHVPTLVIHGVADRMCDVSGGKATAEAIPDAELVLIESMGHDLPAALRPQVADRIAAFVWSVEHRSGTQTGNEPREGMKTVHA
jgi:pimeloyl-ACP methyl ester carboxylesterase